MAIKRITLCVGDCETYEVGGLYVHDSPERGTVTAIEHTNHGFTVYSSKSGSTSYADHYVDANSIVME